MTVGISFTNGLEALVVTDSRETWGNRQSDSINKVGTIKREEFHGAVFGSGDGNIILGVIQNTNDFRGPTPDEYSASIMESHRNKVKAMFTQFFEAKKIEMEARAILISEEPDRKQFFQQELARANQEFEQVLRQRMGMAQFVLVAYDKTLQKICQFHIDDSTNAELFLKYVPIGSGSDGASFYLTTALQGVEHTTLKTADLAFLAVNAYTAASVNVGVGGSPTIVTVAKDGVTTLPLDRTRILTNISAAFLSGYSRDLTNSKARGYFSAAMKEEAMPIEEIAAALNLNSDTLVTTVVPYGSWLERTNLREFGNGRKD